MLTFNYIPKVILKARTKMIASYHSELKPATSINQSINNKPKANYLP